MKYIFIIVIFLLNHNLFCQDSIYRYEEKPLTGKILYIDTMMILYNNKNNILKDIPIELIYGYKQNNTLSILYKKNDLSISVNQMNNYVMGRTLGYKHHISGFPFSVGLFSSYLYTYYNTRKFNRSPRFSSILFIAVPSLIFTHIKYPTDEKWSIEKKLGYQNSRSEKNQIASFIGSIIGTSVIYILYFSK